MEARVTVSHRDKDEVLSLWQWLDGTPAFHRHARMRWDDTSRDGEMGDAFGAIMVLVGAGLSAAQLVVAVLTWRATRPAPVAAIVIESDGVTCSIADHADEARAIRVIEALTAGPEPGADE